VIICLRNMKVLVCYVFDVLCFWLVYSFKKKIIIFDFRLTMLLILKCIAIALVNM